MALLLLNRRAGKGRAAALEPLLRQPLCQARGTGDGHVLATPDGKILVGGGYEYAGFSFGDAALIRLAALDPLRAATLRPPP
jgi:hypothetical protein